MTKKRDLGNEGETLAAAYLEKKGYRIVERNWHCSFGELDIVAKSGETWVFCEVKAIHGENPDEAFLNITQAKAKKLVKAIYYYLNAKRLDEVLWRLDAIALAFPRNGEVQIEHVEDAFDW